MLNSGKIWGNTYVLSYRQEGSRVFLRHKDGRTTVVPNHPGDKLDRGLLNKIIKKDIQISREEFEKLL